jgi:hypothetical protein
MEAGEKHLPPFFYPFEMPGVLVNNLETAPSGKSSMSFN